MRVFVLTAGRTASKTFANACQVLDGMTAGHETRAGVLSGRLEFPDNHVEVDNRLAWFLGGLAVRYSESETFYVHLTRDSERVVESYLKRWHIKVSIVRAFYHGVLMRPEKPSVSQAREGCRLFVATLDENIENYLSQRDNWCLVRVENLEQDFFAFMDKAGLTGDREAIAHLLESPDNVSKAKYNKAPAWKRFINRFSDRRVS